MWQGDFTFELSWRGMPEAEATFQGQLIIMRMMGRDTILGGCCTQCMLYLVYAVLGVCWTWCMLYSVPTHNHDMATLLWGFLMPIINTTCIELSTAIYLRFSFSARLFPRLNLLWPSSKSFQIETVQKTILDINQDTASPSHNPSSEYS